MKCKWQQNNMKNKLADKIKLHKVDRGLQWPTGQQHSIIPEENWNPKFLFLDIILTKKLDFDFKSIKITLCLETCCLLSFHSHDAPLIERKNRQWEEKKQRGCTFTPSSSQTPSHYPFIHAIRWKLPWKVLQALLGACTGSVSCSRALHHEPSTLPTSVHSHKSTIQATVRHSCPRRDLQQRSVAYVAPLWLSAELLLLPFHSTTHVLKCVWGHWLLRTATWVPPHAAWTTFPQASRGSRRGELICRDTQEAEELLFLWLLLLLLLLTWA